MTAETLDPDARYTAADVARIVFGWSADTFRRRRARLTREEGFPRPISKIGRPRWNGWRLIEWEARDQDAPRQAKALPPDVADFSTVLAERSAAIAASGRR